jgi:hypothetical protein
MWTLLVYGVSVTIYHSTMQIHGAFMQESQNYTTTIELAWFRNRVDSIRYLGLTIKHNLSWSEHINKSKEARWYAVPTILQLCRHIYH